MGIELIEAIVPGREAPDVFRFMPDVFVLFQRSVDSIPKKGPECDDGTPEKSIPEKSIPEKSNG
jgi:hypothetical protein